MKRQHEHLRSTYQHYDIITTPERRELLRSDMARRAMVLGQYLQHLDETYTVAPGERQQFSTYEELAIASMRQFVEAEMGIPVTCEVEKYTQLRGSATGVYDVPLHVVAVREVPAETDYGKSIRLGSVLAHEFAHSTAQACTTTVGFSTVTMHATGYVLPHHTVELTPDFRQDHFFEEGLSEEIASRWRIAFDSRLRGRERHLMKNGDHPRIPARLFWSSVPIDEAPADHKFTYGTSAYATFGLQILRDYTGTDIVQLLIDARHPERQESAKARLVETVDSVQPGLYTALTGVGDSMQEYIRGLNLIKQAVADHAHEQHVLVA